MSSTSSRKRKQQGSTGRSVLIVIGVIILALLGGYIGATVRGGGAAAAPGSSAAATTPFLDGIKQRGELRIGIALAPPLTAKLKSGKYGGPNILPLENLAKQLKVKVTTVPAEWGNIVAGLQAGRYDFAAYLDPTVERSMSIRFTDNVLTYQGVLVVPANSPYSTAEQILSSGQPIASAQGSAVGSGAKAAGYTVTDLPDYTGALTAVKAGRAAAEATDSPTAVGQAQADPDVKIIVPDPIFYQSGAAYGVPANIDERSLQVINIAIATTQNSGELKKAFTEVGYLEIDNLGDLQKQ
ncbi:transporter substrate-binding domain-containing protein [Schumannella luteola]|uniref:Polar amino acid transport system substrate-binding protein n=1 Tax=Schumannella luteola TaxID=472059 RepID=A0A852YA94_9MICO|nr:transporter substrate-binding domain-containing protein [Schumannella luteola]NYG98782.1 polar amino acid transport system substrate-binding protein [Schumannella luteola]TPX01620.1 transporter substrate-binding domain-containing protein [Schumannella luteola]